MQGGGQSRARKTPALLGYLFVGVIIGPHSIGPRGRALAVVSYASTGSTLKILALVRELRPELPVVVRTVDDSDIDQLKQAGAAEVVAEILEGSLMFGTQALMLLGVPLNRVLRMIRDTREQRYGLFRGFYRGVTDEMDGGSESLQGAAAKK